MLPEPRFCGRGYRKFSRRIMDRMDQYTEKAKEALALAAEAAENMGVRMVGTEHILCLLYTSDAADEL